MTQWSTNHNSGIMFWLNIGENNTDGGFERNDSEIELWAVVDLENQDEVLKFKIAVNSED
jgi:hypothetical protein